MSKTFINIIFITPVVIIIYITFIVLTGGKVTHAQGFTFDKAYEDYIFTQSNYIQTQTDYKNARDSYLKNPTLTLKDEARNKTLNLLKNRDEFIKVYLTALRLKILENTGLTQDEKNFVFTKLDNEVLWYQNHKDSYSNNDSLEMLFSKNDDSQNQYSTNTLKIIYNAVFTENLGELRSFRLQNMLIYKAIKDFIQTKVDAGTIKIDSFNRWFNDIESLEGQLKTNEDLGQTEITKIYEENSLMPKSTYDNSIDQILKSESLLMQLNNFVSELLTSVKNQIPNGN